MKSERRVYFNLDGTLTELKDRFDEICVDVLEHLDVPKEAINPEDYSEVFLKAFNDFKPCPREHAFQRYAEKHDVDLNADKAANLYKEEELTRSQPRPTLKQTLRRKKEQARTGIITAGTTNIQRRKIRKLGIQLLLDDVRISYEEQLPKEDIFKAIKTNSDEDLLYVSNSKKDIEKARGAGWETSYSTIQDYSVK